MCLSCWFKVMAYEATGSRKNAVGLRALFERQGGRCAYTGRHLTPGIDASLDHRVPRSRGGAMELANVHWVALTVNLMKRALTHEEFLQHCWDVVEYATRGSAFQRKE